MADTTTATEIKRPRDPLRDLPAVSMSPPERDEPNQDRRDHANRRTDGELIGKLVGKSATNKNNPRDSGTGDPDRTAQQPSWKECAEQIK